MELNKNLKACEGLLTFSTESKDEKKVAIINTGIAEHKPAEEELQFMKALLATQLEASTDGILVVDEKGCIQSYNRRFAEMWGIPADITDGRENKSALQAVMTRMKDPGSFMELIQSLDKHRRETSRDEVVLSDGRVFDRFSSPVFGTDDRYHGRVWHFRDISECRKAERALLESENIFKSFSEQLLAGIYIMQDGFFKYVNEKFAQMFGYTVEECLDHMSFRDLVYPGDLASVEEEVRRRVSGEVQCVQYSFRGLKKSGQIFYVEIYGATCIYEGAPASIGTILDITERKRSEDALRNSEERFRLFIEHAPASLAMFDREMRYLSTSRRWMGDFKLGDRDLIGLSHYEVFPEVSEYLKSVHRRALAGEVVGCDAGRFERADGSVDWLKWEVRPWRDQTGQIAGIVIFTEDITERKQAEEALQKSEERFSQAMEATSDGIWDWDLTSGKVYYSPGYFRMLGYEPEEFPGEADTWLGLIHPDDRERTLATNEACIRNESPVVNVEFRMLSRDGTWRWIMGRGKAVRRDENGRALHMIGTHVDITERKRAEEEKARIEVQLRQAQKMEALGTLAGGIAHDLNNILGVIFAYSELAHTNADDCERVRKHLHEVIKAGNRAKDLVKQILAFSRQGKHAARPLEIGLIVKEALKMLRASLPATIEIKPNLDCKAVVSADPTQIHQILMNLCTNAAHSMHDMGGVLEVSLASVSLGKESMPHNTELAPGPYVGLTVKDTGHGIDSSIMDRIFDPFFSTKEQGVGTGLGLAVVHGIVNTLGGFIDVDSSVGKGTSFRVLLPETETAPAPLEHSSAPLPRGRERILIVDDEPVLAEAIKQMLEHLGYEVEYSSNGIEALQVIRHGINDKTFDLVITDMTMPRMTGTELAGEISKLQPGLPIVLCTGFSEKANAEVIKDLGLDGFLMKPVTMKDLADVVRKAIGKRTPESQE